MILASFSTDAHDVAIYVVCGITLLLVLGTGRLLWRGTNVVVKIGRFVIPHFEPPTEQEIREGIEDNTLPARMKAMEDRLTRHLTDEETASSALYKRIEAIESAVRPGPRR